MARFCPNDCGRSFRDGGGGLAFHLTWCRPAAPDPLPVVACVPPTYAHVYDRPSLAELVTLEPEPVSVAPAVDALGIAYERMTQAEYAAARHAIINPEPEPYNALRDPAYLKRAEEKRNADDAANRAAFEAAQARRTPVVRQPARTRKRAHVAPVVVTPERVFSISEPTRREPDPILPAVWKIATATAEGYVIGTYSKFIPDTLRGKFSIHHTARTLEIEKVRPIFDPLAADPLGPWAGYGPAAPVRDRERVKHAAFSGWRGIPDPLATTASPRPAGVIPGTGRRVNAALSFSGHELRAAARHQVAA